MTIIRNTKELMRLRRSLRRHQTDAERVLWTKLRGKQLNNVRFHRQFSVGKYIVDFYCPKHRLAIELDGGQHGEVSIEQSDVLRTKFLEVQGITVLRFWDNDVFKNINGILEVISARLTPPDLPFKKGEEE